MPNPPPPPSLVVAAAVVALLPSAMEAARPVCSLGRWRRPLMCPWTLTSSRFLLGSLFILHASGFILVDLSLVCCGWMGLALAGIYLAERLNSFLGDHWKSFATQNYFDPHGIFLSTLWLGPPLVIAIIILVKTLFSLCHLFLCAIS
ncbi:hypothetical protein MLD38_000332 [Melastoma candidum]|uniref:Uncharacterized protein n=1 Tax=Melastoma candidum TaxID=119954 RepID=A0ACB9SDN8_9MYRT|nr:hypothetical protein MLD38_000332 [Melastoma candidum]